jgi:uncharacterized membrane protein YgaE (UPF0421/DUF939 family)
VSGLRADASIVGHAARDVFVALSAEFAELHLIGGRGRQCAMTALAVALAATIALALRVDAVWWAAVSAFVSVQTSAPASLRRGVLRIAGTAIGAAAGFLMSPLLVEDFVAVSLVLLVVSTAGVLGLLVSPRGYAWLLGAVTIDMVLLAGLADPLSTLNVACSRTAEVTIGTLSAIIVAVLLAPRAEPAPPPVAPGWSDLLGAQWPAVQHALRAGIGVTMVPLAWNWMELPSLSQTAITVAAVMAVPALSNDAAKDRGKIVGRALHRILGCLLGGVAGMACLIEDFMPWLFALTAGIWIAAHLQGSQRGIGYVGTQGAVVFISTLIQGLGPPASILPGIERFAGIAGGLAILLVVSLVTASDAQETRQKEDHDAIRAIV